MRYFNTHSGKAVLAVTGTVMILAVPITLPWVAAVLLLDYGVRQLKLAFEEVDHDVLTVQSGHTPLLEPRDGQRVLDGTCRDLVAARPPIH